MKFASVRFNSSLTFTNTTDRPGRSRDSEMSMRSSSSSRRRRRQERRHPPQQRAGAAPRPGRGGGEHLRRWPERRQQPRRVALARHRHDRVGPRGRGQRHRRLAQRAAMQAAGRVGAWNDAFGWRHQLRVADHRVESLDGADRIGSGRGLPGEHDRVRPFVHGIGGVADLGARRPRLDPHRLEHLRGQDRPAGRRRERAG